MSFERALCGLGATVSLAALLASATPALAQAAAPAGEAVQEARPSDAAAGGIEDIIVTARIRRETAMQRSEEHTSELQSLMRISYAVFCLKKKKKQNNKQKQHEGHIKRKQTK